MSDLPEATWCPRSDESLPSGTRLRRLAPAFVPWAPPAHPAATPCRWPVPGAPGPRQGVGLQALPPPRRPLLRSHASLLPCSTWRSCPSWRPTPSRCRAATRRWSHCGLTGCSSVSMCPARPCLSSEPRSTCERWARSTPPPRRSMPIIHLPPAQCRPLPRALGPGPRAAPGMLTPAPASWALPSAGTFVTLADLASSFRSLPGDPFLWEALLTPQVPSCRAQDLCFLEAGTGPVPGIMPVHSRHSGKMWVNEGMSTQAAPRPPWQAWWAG